MLTKYRSITAKAGGGQAPDDSDAVWMDALNPTPNELEELRRWVDIDMPALQDMEAIELSNRLYDENGVQVMIANFLPYAGRDVHSYEPAAFILAERCLITIRFSELHSFDIVAKEANAGKLSAIPAAYLLRLLDAAVGDMADELEFCMRGMEELSIRLFSRHGANATTGPEGPDMARALQIIGGMGERVSNIRESIASIQRVVNYAGNYLPKNWLVDQDGVMRALRNDLTALSDEAAFFMNKLSFNLDASLGMINIEENKVIRLLAIVTLLFSPPTLIAGIYGMNFDLMPELHWRLGYVFALALMIATAVATIWFLKRRRWM